MRLSEFKRESGCGRAHLPASITLWLLPSPPGKQLSLSGNQLWKQTVAQRAASRQLPPSGPTQHGHSEGSAGSSLAVCLVRPGKGPCLVSLFHPLPSCPEQHFPFMGISWEGDPNTLIFNRLTSPYFCKSLKIIRAFSKIYIITSRKLRIVSWSS